jgi:hypothetical protein
MSKLQTTSSAIARSARAGDPGAEADARREHAAMSIEVAIERALASAPPLSPTQVKRISALLRSAK